MTTSASDKPTTVVERIKRDFKVINLGSFFDEATLEAVEALEEETGIPVDGEVGRVTWQQLFAPVRRGQANDAVRAALRRVEEEVLKDHVAHCVEHAITSGNKGEQRRKVAELIDVLGRSGR